ncbi:hypothetical protein SARC_11371, partial [Sphaeroforma arctica JP610]
VEFYISFKFQSPVYAALASNTFNTIAGKTMNAFYHRCEEKYPHNRHHKDTPLDHQ